MITPFWGLTNNPKMGTFILPHNGGIGAKMKPKEITYVKVRLNDELHKRLKAKARLEERSMNYLINKAVELLIAQNREVKA